MLRSFVAFYGYEPVFWLAVSVAWWLGYCTITGGAVGFRTTCQLPEWQAKNSSEHFFIQD